MGERILTGCDPLNGFSTRTVTVLTDDVLSEEAVMHDVGVMLVDGMSFSDIARVLVPIAFRLLCRAALRPAAPPLSQVRGWIESLPRYSGGDRYATPDGDRLDREQVLGILR